MYIDSLLGVAHTLFALEDIYGLAIAKEDGSYCLEPNIFKSPRAGEIQTFMKAWYEMEAKRKAGEITQEEYDRWRYHYPKYDTTQIRTRVPSKGFRDAFLKALSEEPDE